MKGFLITASSLPTATISHPDSAENSNDAAINLLNFPDNALLRISAGLEMSLLDSDQCYIMKLPTELRLDIFDHVSYHPNKQDVLADTSQLSDRSDIVRVQRSYKTLFESTSRLLYRTISVEVGFDDQDMLTNMLSPQNEGVQSIRKMEYSLDFNWSGTCPSLYFLVDGSDRMAQGQLTHYR